MAFCLATYSVSYCANVNKQTNKQKATKTRNKAVTPMKTGIQAKSEKQLTRVFLGEMRKNEDCWSDMIKLKKYNPCSTFPILEHTTFFTNI